MIIKNQGTALVQRWQQFKSLQTDTMQKKDYVKGLEAL